MIVRTNKMLFVTDSDDSDCYIENLRTEYKEGKRQLRRELFSSSKLEKIVKFINDNFQ